MMTKTCNQAVPYNCSDEISICTGSFAVCITWYSFTFSLSRSNKGKL